MLTNLNSFPCHSPPSEMVQASKKHDVEQSREVGLLRRSLNLSWATDGDNEHTAELRILPPLLCQAAPLRGQK